MTEKQQYLYNALSTCKDAQAHYDLSKQYRQKSQADGSSIFRSVDYKLMRESEKEKEIAKSIISGYEDVRDAIPASWRTAPMYLHMMEFVEEGYSDEIVDVVMNYRYYFRNLQKKHGICD